MGTPHSTDSIVSFTSARHCRALGILFSIIASAVTMAHAAVSSRGDDVPRSIPDGLLALASPHAIVVEKSNQRLYLYGNSQHGLELIKTYSCSTGKNKGDKIEPGDLRTPEGCYFFTTLHKGTSLPSRYGAMAFVLDFPNYVDQQRGKRGNGIWLHGLDKPLMPFDTQGCVALCNEDIIELSRYIRLYDTPILITETLTAVDPERYDRERTEALQLLAAWRNAWQGKDLQRFLACYSPDRYGQGKLRTLAATKKDLNARYKFISIDLHRLNILKHGDTIVAGFVQDYESDTFCSTGFKKLYLQKNSERLAIVGEDWENEAPVAPPAGEVSDERRICRMLNRWIKAWEEKDMEAYIDCYAPDFTSHKMNRRQWKEYKEGIGRATRRITVGVENIMITVKGPTAVVTFAQRYSSDAHSDYGKKTLHLRRAGNDWNIVKEVWEPL
ncbi:MAG: L,D-transpeptidase family protein [Desulfobacterota bacterium]|nr:L,D-transpeptidase family protein [Thermodesulfobacteriota bacterium]